MAIERTLQADGAKSAVEKPTRSIPAKVSLFLYTQAGGRCEFLGCNKYLLEHYPTEELGNFAEKAHIYAFREDGPRGKADGRPVDINILSNLILLCPECHHLVDQVAPEKYPVEILKKYKRDHEDRIFDLTDIDDDLRTIPLVVRGLIAGRRTDISDQEMVDAVRPNWLSRREKVEIDFSIVPDTPNKAFWDTSISAITTKLNQIYSLVPDQGQVISVSVFALAPIPLLIFLGSRLSDKIKVDLYQRHRDTESWSWSNDRGTVNYSSVGIEKDGTSKHVALLINLSGKNPVDMVKNVLGNAATIYELTYDGEVTPHFLMTREDLANFDTEYRRVLAKIRNEHPGLDVLHVFPAVPAPVAITIGRSRLPKVDPKLRIYDRDTRAGGFVETLEIS